MLYIVELEPMKERYTYWWSSYITEKLKKIGIKHEVINGIALTDSVETGTVLDAAGTNFWKASQLQNIASKFYNNSISPYDTFLICDIWYPGIEMIRYMSQLYNIPVNIYGVWHAGSTTIGDFAEPMHVWSKYFEIGFLNICNGIFVGSDYSKESIVDRLLYSLPQSEAKSIEKRIYSCGMPLQFQKIKKQTKTEKENIILFPHRPDEEKNINIFIDILNGLSTWWEDFENYKIVFCTSKKQYKSKSAWINASLAQLKTTHPNIFIKEDLNEEEYHSLLGKSKLMISTTIEENFGYCAVEALSAGCKVLLPNSFSHPELVDGNYELLYESYDELMDKIPKSITTEYSIEEMQSYAEPYDFVVEEWIRIMGWKQ